MPKKKHLGFDKVSQNIAQEYIKKGMSTKKANPKLKKVKGAMGKVKCACKTKASASKPIKSACKTKAACKGKK